MASLFERDILFVVLGSGCKNERALWLRMEVEFLAGHFLLGGGVKV